MNQEDCNALIEKVFEFYRSLNLKVDENTKIVLVDNNQMSRLCNGKVTTLYKRQTLVHDASV
jgi:hypothetical protein